MRFLMVAVGPERYAINADAVTGILARPGDSGPADPAVGPGPGQEPSRQVDLHRLIGARPARTGVTLVMRSGAATVHVPVDGAETILDVPASSIAPLPPFIFAGPPRLFRGLLESGRDRWLLLDEESLS